MENEKIISEQQINDLLIDINMTLYTLKNELGFKKWSEINANIPYQMKFLNKIIMFIYKKNDKNIFFKLEENPSLFILLDINSERISVINLENHSINIKYTLEIMIKKEKAE